MNNDLYQKTITVDGAVYHYDPDRDIYYRYQEMTAWDAWSPLIVLAVLSVACLLIEYFK